MTRVLSFHATYRCRDSGACCTSGWPIPIDHDGARRLRRAMEVGALTAVGPADSVLSPLDVAGDQSSILAAIPGHGCTFYRRADPLGCAIHHALGHDALPLACRQFPRVVVRDPRGVSVTLSHYCPTAAGLLDDTAPIALVTNPPRFPDHGEYEGLDATQALPPLLRPEMLMDWEAWWQWEARSVALIAREDCSPRMALHRLASVVEDVRTWRPDDGTLADRIDDAFARSAGRETTDTHGPGADAVFATVLAAIPDRWRPRDTPRVAVPSNGAQRRFLAAHAFGSWIAHEGRGVRTWWRSLDAALTLLEAGHGVRQTDLLLRHLADHQVLAETWSASEIEPPTKRAG